MGPEFAGSIGVDMAMKTIYVKCSLVIMALLLGGTGVSSFAAEDYAFPISYPKNINTYTVRKDGSFQVMHEGFMRIDTEDAVSNFGEEKISYIPNLESVKILDAYTILPDGSRIKVPPENIRTAKGDMDSADASYSDTQYEVIIYPNVVVGSQLYLKYIQVHHTPLFLGQFSFRQTMSPYIKFGHFEVNVIFEPGIDIKLDSKGVDGGMLPDKDGMHRYRYTYKQDKIIPIEPYQIDSDDYAPYVQATTFASYEALGAAYQEKATQKANVTPAIQRLADDLTRGVDGQRGQARILYNWVSKNIRYVGSYMGNGGYVPHDSQTILDNRWGDCKDHVVILEALLAAKGIGSSPALISSGESYVLPTLAGLVFNHVITYVPSLDLYLDSTARLAPFGTLPSPELNKSVVLTGLNRVGKTPPMLAQEHRSQTSTWLKVMPDGTIQGSSRSQASGVEEIDLRVGRFSDQAAPQGGVVNNRLSAVGLTGIGDIHSNDPADLDKPLEVKTTFTLDPVSNFPGPAAMPIPAGLAFGVLKGGMLRRPKDRINSPVSCHSFVYSNHYEIEFPPNIRITHVPDNVRYKDGVIQYTATYMLKGNKLEISRELVNQYPTMVCGEAENEMNKRFFPVFQRDMRAQVIYE